VVKAVVVPKRDFRMRVFEEFCKEHLAKHKRPALIEVAEVLPRTSLGKVFRRTLRESHVTVPRC
jgi:acyl-CoA synthetase (AMP-forming)/AMP-acid ligase II